MKILNFQLIQKSINFFFHFNGSYQMSNAAWKINYSTYYFFVKFWLHAVDKVVFFTGGWHIDRLAACISPIAVYSGNKIGHTYIISFTHSLFAAFHSLLCLALIQSIECEPSSLSYERATLMMIYGSCGKTNLANYCKNGLMSHPLFALLSIYLHKRNAW